MSKKRDTGTEVLRIVAMLMIVCSHFAVHGGIDYANSFNLNNVFVNAMEFGGKIGVNIFVLITGYYSCTSKFSFGRIFKLLFAVECYSVILFGVSVIVGAIPLSRKMLLEAVFPTLFGDGYWFIVIYLVMYCISPLINAGLNSISQKMHGFMVLFLLSMYCFLPSTIGLFKRLNDFGFSNLIWFITIYMVGAYFRKYPFVLFKRNGLSLVLLCASLVLILLGTTLKFYNNVMETSSLVVNKIGAFFGNTGLSSFMVLVVSVLMFIVFQSKSLRIPNWMFSVSKSTFGIYLIHDNNKFRTFLWENICKTTSMAESDYFIAYAIVCVLLVFAICSIIEIMREKYIERKVFSSAKVKALLLKLDNKIN